MKKQKAQSEVQGSGRAYWFNDLSAAKEFAAMKLSKGHIVSVDEEEAYVWVSFSTKKHSGRTLMVEAGFDALAV